MRIALLLIGSLAIAAASPSDWVSEDVVPETEMQLLHEQAFTEASDQLETILLDVTNMDKASMKGKVGVTGKVSVARPKGGPKKGFNAYFYSNIRNLRNVGQAMSAISRRRPSRHITVSRIQYASTGGHWSGLTNAYRDHYVGKFTGSIHVAKSGTYNFWTVSDDGSRAYVKGKLVVNNDGLHGMRTRHGGIHLKKGYAPIQVYYFERTGGAGLKVDWSGPGFSRRPLGSSSVSTSRPVKVPKKVKAGCISNAKKSIKSIEHAVKNAQSVLNQMDNGKHCAGKGQKTIKDAMRSLENKRKAEKKAQKEYDHARNARINVSVTFSSGIRNCRAFTDSAQWRRARRNVSNTKNTLIRAKAQVRDAQKFLTKMKKQARADRCKCKHRVENAAHAAVTQARKLTPQRKKGIIRELMLICLVKARSKKTPSARNNAGQACKRQGLPSKYNAKLTLHKTKMVNMNFKCKKCGGVWCSASHYERYTKEIHNKERSQKERKSKERARKVAFSRERSQKERNSKERSRKARAWQNGVTWVQAYGYGWRTLGGHDINGPARYCDSNWKTMPYNCQVAPYDSYGRAMAKSRCWSTSVAVFSNGVGWGTSCFPYNQWAPGTNLLGQSGNSYKTNSCTMAVLLRCGMS